MKRPLRALSALILLAAAALFVSGCGYSMAGSKRAPLAFETVDIVYINNATLEPGLQDGFRKALSSELMKRGVILELGAKTRLSGTITRFVVTGLAEKDGYFTEYDVMISGRFRLKKAGGKEFDLGGRGPFIVSFPIMGGMAGFSGLKEVAVKRAVEDLAAEVAAAALRAE